jgi:aminopeptidase N
MNIVAVNDFNMGAMENKGTRPFPSVHIRYKSLLVV